MLRICETEDFDAMMVFVRTKQATEEVSDFMAANGFKCAPLNGDIPQALREKAVEKLKAGQLDIIVATDVAARGLDVERISHVINYDIPSDTESYVHRIGRTGRAGRNGEAIVFVRGREKRMLRDIEKATRQPIEEMPLPSAKQVNEKRRERFEGRILDAIHSEKNKVYREMIEEILSKNPVDSLDVAAAVASLMQGEKPLFIDEKADERMMSRDREPREPRERRERGDRPERGERRERGDRAPRAPKALPEGRAKPLKGHPEVEMTRYMVAVGYDDGLKPGNLVGAIANEGDLDSEYIGNIEICEQFAVIDLPNGMPTAVMSKLKKARVCGRPLDMQVYKPSEVPQGSGNGGNSRPPRKPAGRNFEDRGERRERSDRGERQDRGPKKPHRGKNDGKPRAPRKNDR